MGPYSMERVYRAVDRVRDRLDRATAALDNAGVPYAVIGGNAVATWVSGVDEAAVRFTQDVDILLRRADHESAALALESIGFIRRHVKGIDMFLDGPGAKARDAVHVVFAGEKVRPESLEPSPDVSESERPGAFQVLSLPALVRMKLTSFRDKDRTHLRDLIGVGLIDPDWIPRFAPELGARLRQIFDTPEG